MSIALESNLRLVRRAVLALARRFESAAINRARSCPWPPIFIIGPARSGTTLVYQALCRALRVCYFNNAMLRWGEFPVLISRLAAGFGACTPTANFDSKYAKTQGWSAPNQGVEIWDRWFPRQGQSSSRAHLSRRETSRLRSVVGAMETIFKCPFLNKWQGHGAHLRQLDRVFPRAVFIRIHRDLIDTVQSNYRGRVDLLGDPTRNFTRVTRSYGSQVGRSPIQQICSYIAAYERDVDDDEGQIGPHRFLSLTYEEFCQSPMKTARQVISWYGKVTGMQMSIRAPLPDSFSPSRGKKVDDEVLAEIRMALTDHILA